MGAVATALVFDMGTLLLSMIVAEGVDSPYGTAASVLALLAWVYYSAQVFLFGAELTRIFATTYGGGIVPVHRSSRGVCGILRSNKRRRHGQISATIRYFSSSASTHYCGLSAAGAAMKASMATRNASGCSTHGKWPHLCK